MREGLLCLLSMGEEEGRSNAEGHDGVERNAELGEHGVFLSVGFASLMGSLYWHRDRVLVAVGASGVAVCRMRRGGGREDVRAPGSQDSLAVPIPGGAWALHANNLWQRQS